MTEIPGYTLMRQLGRGGMGEVYLAVQQSLGREVALKVLTETLSKDPVACERFVREARIAANLRHPHIVPIYDVGVYQATAYIAMEYESGGTVAALAHEHLDASQALKIVRDIADALDYAHRQGVIHRDVKPENILRRADGLCLLSDFGIARAVEATTILTHEGASVGTPQYMSPEQLRGQNIDGRSDLYSIGVVLYQLLTGEVPYSGSDSYVLGMQHINAPIPRLPADLVHVQPLIDALMAKDPSARPQTGADVVSRIDALLAGATPALTRPLTTLEASSPWNRNRLLIGAVALLAALVLSWYFIGHRASQRAATTPPAASSAVKSAPGPQGTGPVAERTAPAPRSIAVLPFVNMSGEAENEFFSDGLSEEILNSLARIDNMQVVGRTSSFQFKGKNEDLRGVGDKLGVANVLEGSVRRSGDRARITAQLVRASDGFHLWSDTYDRTVNDAFAVQLDIAEHVAGALEVVLDDKQRERMREAGVKNVDAFVAFQKARRLYTDAHDPTRSDNLIATLRRADVEFKKATALEPDFAAAYYLGTDFYSHTIASDAGSRAEHEAALRDELRDLDLAARSSHDPKQRLLIALDRQLLTEDWRGLKERFALAMADPGCHQSNWGLVGMAFGFAEERIKAMRQYIACEPLFAFAYVHGASAAIFAGRPEEALDFVTLGNRALGGLPPLTLNGVRALVLLGRIDEARAQLATLDPDDFAGATAKLVLGAAVGDDIRAIREHSQHARKPAWNPEYWDSFDVLAEALLGERDAANRRAAAIDAMPSGPLRLAGLVAGCQCGAPFDLDATPNFKARLAESGLAWPPPDPLAALKRKVAH